MANTSLKAVLLAILFFNLSLTLAAGTQFITGNCTSDADCADSCCGFNTGKCAGPVIAQEIDGGCGFGDAEPNDTAAVALGFTGTGAGSGNASSATEESALAVAAMASTTFATSVTPAAAATAAAGTQFITGPCTSDADCAEGCCGFNTGKCAGPVVAQEVDGGCGFGDAQPNSIAAQKLGFNGTITG